MFWGFVAVFFLLPVWIGMAAIVISMQLLIIYMLNAMTQPRLLLANAIRYLSANREIACQLGQNGREHIVRKFSRGQTAEKYIRMLEDLLKLPQPHSTKAAA